MRDRLKEKIDIRRAELLVGRSVEEWLAPDVAKIIATWKAIEDGMATIDDAFPPVPGSAAAEAEAAPAAASSLDKFAPGDKPDASATASTEQPAETLDAVGTARRRGERAAADGLARRAIPPEYRDSPDERDAWNAGYDAKKGETK